MDAGAVMRVLYEGEEVLQITSQIYREWNSRTGEWGPGVAYDCTEVDGTSNRGWTAFLLTAEAPGGCPEELISSSLYHGIAFRLRNDGSGVGYRPTLDVEYRISVSGDVLIDTLFGSAQGETMTMDQFYEERMADGNGAVYLIRVTEENGEVAKIVECYVP